MKRRSLFEEVRGGALFAALSYLTEAMQSGMLGIDVLAQEKARGSWAQRKRERASQPHRKRQPFCSNYPSRLRQARPNASAAIWKQGAPSTMLCCRKDNAVCAR